MIANRRAIDELAAFSKTPFAGQGICGLDNLPPPIFKAPFSDPDNPLLVEYGGPLTMVRATKGWYLNPLTGLITEAANNILRIEANGELMEGQRTNHCLQSRDFDTTWNPTNVSLAQNEVGIDGVANTAWTITDTSNSAIGNLNQDITIPNDSNTDVFSIFIKKDNDETRFPEFILNQIDGTATQHYIRINTKTGATYEHFDSEGDVFELVDFNSTWWRLWIATTNNGSGNTTARLSMRPSAASVLNGSDDPTLQGSVVIDGAQLEKDVPFPSSFIPTTDAAVTRNADFLTFASSGNITTGPVSIVLKSNIYADDGSTNQNIIDTRRITPTEDGFVMVWQPGTSNFRGGLSSGGDAQASITIGSSIGTQRKLGFVWDTNDARFYLDGTAGTPDTTVTNPLAHQANINLGVHNNDSANQMWGHIQDLRIWDVALSDQQMKNLTT